METPKERLARLRAAAQRMEAVTARAGRITQVTLLLCMFACWVTAGWVLCACSMQRRGAVPFLLCWTQAVTWLLAHAWDGQGRWCRHSVVHARLLDPYHLLGACHAMPCRLLQCWVVSCLAMPCHAVPCSCTPIVGYRACSTFHANPYTLHHAIPLHNRRSISMCPLLGRQGSFWDGSRRQRQESQAWLRRRQSGASERKPLLQVRVSEHCFLCVLKPVRLRVSWAVEPQVKVAASCCSADGCPSDFSCTCH